MGFWIFMLLMDLIIPLTMIGFGRYLMKNNPKEPNALFGYRTAMSLKNKDTWAFANTYCGKIWYVCGWILLPVTVIFLLLVIGKSIHVVGTAGGIICGVQLVPFIGSVFPTELALKTINTQARRPFVRRPDRIGNRFATALSRPVPSCACSLQSFPL